MLRKVVLGLLLLVGLVLVVGCLGQARKPTGAPTTRDTGLPTSTPTPCDDCPDRQPTATETPTLALPPAPIPGHPAPDFALPNLEGKELSLSDFRGQVVLVNFWATW